MIQFKLNDPRNWRPGLLLRCEERRGKSRCVFVKGHTGWHRGSNGTQWWVASEIAGSLHLEHTVRGCPVCERKACAENDHLFAPRRHLTWFERFLAWLVK